MNEIFKAAGFLPADILVPHDIEMEKWSVIACDQYTSDRAYWDDVKELVGDAPSALKLMLPEAYLDDPGLDERISESWRLMRQYVNDGVFAEYPSSFVYVERELRSGGVRRGLVGMADMERYDYHSGASSDIRATEGTVLSRIPPRVRLREGAALELPHILLLCDDPDGFLIEHVCDIKQSLPVLYDFQLMKRGGHITGRLVSGDALDVVAAGMEKYVARPAPFRFASGDGNHSLATAKACYEAQKLAGASAEQLELSRYVLCELVNLRDTSLRFEPIHRFAFGTTAEVMKKAALQTRGDEIYRIAMTSSAGDDVLELRGKAGLLPVGVLQDFLDDIGGEIDYIHGEVALRSMSGGVGFILKAMDKAALFPAVEAGGCLPRKTFSMGEADEKRFYLEASRCMPSGVARRTICEA